MRQWFWNAVDCRSGVYDKVNLVAGFDAFQRPDPLLFSKPVRPTFQAGFRQAACSASHSSLCVPSMQGSLICRPAAMAAQTPDALLPGQKSDTAWIRQTRFVMTAGRAGFTRGAAFERALVCSHYPARDGKARLVRHLHARHARQLLVQHDVSAFEGDVGQAI